MSPGGLKLFLIKVWPFCHIVIDFRLIGTFFVVQVVYVVVLMVLSVMEAHIVRIGTYF